MKQITDITKNIAIKNTIGDSERSIAGIHFDSRQVDKDFVFVAVKGLQTDGHKFIEPAIKKGATIIVCETVPQNTQENITYLQVDNSAEALALMASAFYGHPSTKLKLVGVTGTNGKTTTATLLYRLFEELGYRAGLISTVRNHIHDKTLATRFTTPDAIEINKLLDEMVQSGCDYCFMEVSSHALIQHRTTGLHFAGAIFTNITQDHLDYHKTFDEYIYAKKMFFDALPADAFALTNADDKNGMVMLQNTKAQKYTYAMKSMADFKCKMLENHFSGMLLNFDKLDVWTRFIGEFNACNLLAVYAAAILLKQQKQEVLTVISDLKPVDGRFETIRSKNNITAIVDYSHTPDALHNILKAINQIRDGKEQLITVAGAGGDRDKTKRPIMAGIATEFSDKVILTSDNPRTEKPADIIEDMKEGVESKDSHKVLSITDRREAIKTACFMAQAGDIILVAGKGHETYQEINGVRHHFDDREIIREQFGIIDKAQK